MFKHVGHFFLSYKARTSRERKHGPWPLGSRERHGAWRLAGLTQTPPRRLAAWANFPSPSVLTYKMRLGTKKMCKLIMRIA